MIQKSRPSGVISLPRCRFESRPTHGASFATRDSCLRKHSAERAGFRIQADLGPELGRAQSAVAPSLHALRPLNPTHAGASLVAHAREPRRQAVRVRNAGDRTDTIPRTANEPIFA